MNILALDLGTKTGWAVHQTVPAPSRGGTGYFLRDGGTWVLSDTKTLLAARKAETIRSIDPRFESLLEHLADACNRYSVEKLIFEDVLFSAYTLQTQLWSSLRAAVWAIAISGHLEIDCLNTASLKKFATGHGGATKLMMAAHLVKKHPLEFSKLAKPFPKRDLYLCKPHETGLESSFLVDDNEVDARHLLDYALTTSTTGQ